jgi:hypothetical protein
LLKNESNPTQVQGQMESQRVVKVDAHVLAYLGDYMRFFQETIKKQAKDILRAETKPIRKSPVPNKSDH